jgi:hypothetical protein
LVALAPAAALADGSVGPVRAFGLLGTWALDCGRPVSSENPRVRYAVTGDPANVIHTFRVSDADQGPGETAVYAEIAAPDRLFLVLHRDGVPTLASVIRRTGDTIQVTDSLNSAGRHLILGGTVAATNKPSPVYRRCGD